MTVNPSPTDQPPSAATCNMCGRTESEPAASGWTRQVGERGRIEWLCGRCTRDNLRSIEGRLDEAWW